MIILREKLSMLVLAISAKFRGYIMATILIQGGGYANAADAITAANFEISGSSWTSAKEIVNVDVLREGNQWRYYFIYEE